MKKGFRLLNLLAVSAVIGLSLYGFFLLHHRPGFPEGIDRAAVSQVEGHPVRDPDELNFLLARKAIGDRVVLGLRTAGGTRTEAVTLVPYYSQTPFPVIYLVIGLINFGIGLAVFLLKPRDILARIFCWAMAAFSYAIIISGEFYCAGPTLITHLPGFFFNILYPLAPALLVHFSLALSGSSKRWQYSLIYGPPLVLAAVIDGLYVSALRTGSLPLFRRELQAVYVLRWYIVLAVGLTLVHLVLRVRRTEQEEEKAQIQWFLYGLVIGLLPFVLLYQLPRILGRPPLLSEELSSVFYIVIPLACAIAIVKFKLMHVELVINRSLVYALLTMLLVSVYLFSMEVFRPLFSRVTKAPSRSLALVATILVAAAFHPARKKIQGFVDKAFFRESFDARQAVLSFSDGAQRLADVERLADLFLERLAAVLPVEALHLAIYDEEIAPSGPRLVRGSPEAVQGLAPGAWASEAVLARRPAVRLTSGLDFSGEAFLELHAVDLVLRLPFNTPVLRGFVALAGKKSGERYSFDDLQFLSALLAELTLHLERIKLQEEVVYERASREKLAELNLLKTEFISTVSHELRTPLTSLQGLVEILQSGKLRDAARREQVLDIMAGESSRLSRLLHNILDYGAIEQRAKVYDLREMALQPVVEEVVQLFRFSGEARGFTLTESLPPQPLLLKLDPDAVKQALINLVDNAIKYSGERKEVEIRVVEGSQEVEVQVRDWGIGIPAPERERVFDRFFRSAEAGRHNPRGVGLGLKIVKHIMEAHGGGVRVCPGPECGTIITLVFPRR